MCKCQQVLHFAACNTRNFLYDRLRRRGEICDVQFELTVEQVICFIDWNRN
jgi:hypothetical protein